ncbi:MAG: hemerythrin domain-containing protein, partial [Gammaproteobacteria bacterium]|nr:hemerythrin domain-containing protein [Gammaproteobacteria bacterium]
MREQLQSWRSDGAAPTPRRVLRNPLDFLAHDHMRERHVCATILKIAEGGGDVPPGDIEMILDFLGEEFTDHVADEERVLYPMLLTR